MKKILILLFVLSFVACGLETEVKDVEFHDSYYKLEIAEGMRYFRYPIGANVTVFDGGGLVVFDDCEIEFGKGVEVEYQFWSKSLGDNFSKCSSIANVMEKSFTDKLTYISNKYHFALRLRYDFENEILPDDGGVVMRSNQDGYVVEIKVKAEDNVWEYGSIGDLLAEKYLGYSYKFANFSNFSGVFVDDASGEFALRVFIVFSDDAKVIYSLTMQVPKEKYLYHMDLLDGILENFEIL